MPPGCLILGDTAVHNLLTHLSRTEILTFQHTLQLSLQRFSSSTEKALQPDSGVSIRPNGSKTLFRPFTSPSHVGCKIIVDPAPPNNPSQEGEKKKQQKEEEEKSGLHGILVLCDSQGIPAGIINAEEITGFRTSLCALIPWMWRKFTRKVVVFGAGKVALWHVRLMLALRGEEMEELVVVNRRVERGEEMVRKVRGEGWWGEKEGQTKVEMKCVASGDVEAVKACVREADVVCCTVPSQEPLFQDEDLMRGSAVAGQPHKQPYISAIGSWQPDMIELDPALLRRIVSEKDAFNPIAKDCGGAIIVDDRTAVSEHTGEILQSGLLLEQMVELGTVLEMMEKKKKEKKEEEEENNSGDEDHHHARLEAWLREGYVVYKSVGVALTDLASGEAILELAKKHEGMGTLVTDL